MVTSTGGPQPDAAQQETRRRLGVLVGSALAILLLVVGAAIGYLAAQPERNTKPPTASPRPPDGIRPPPIDPSFLPVDGPPSPAGPTEQTYSCTEVGVLPDTDFRVQPQYMDGLNLPAAWQYGRGGGVRVAVIDTGVSRRSRLPHLVGGGDYVAAGGDGLADCDGHGTIVASMIGAAPSPGDAFSGIAPDVDLISIRQFSDAFTHTGGEDPTNRALDPIHALARAIVHAANMGAAVINVSGVVCMRAHAILDQNDLGAAVRYAAVDKNAVIVAAAGDTSRRDCNPNPIAANEPPDWNRVDTVVTPDWFNEYVLTVGATDATGEPLKKLSIAGPWVAVAAPGANVVGLSPRDDSLINAIIGPDNMLLVPTSTGFSAAIVSGVAALVRAKYSQLSAHQIVDRLVRTAKPGHATDQTGYGVIDPVAALTRDVN